MQAVITNYETELVSLKPQVQPEVIKNDYSDFQASKKSFDDVLQDVSRETAEPVKYDEKQPVSKNETSENVKQDEKVTSAEDFEKVSKNDKAEILEKKEGFEELKERFSKTEKTLSHENVQKSEVKELTEVQKEAELNLDRLTRAFLKEEKSVKDEKVEVKAKNQKTNEKTFAEKEMAKVEEPVLNLANVQIDSEKLSVQMEEFEAAGEDFDISVKEKGGKTFNLDKEGKITVHDLRTESETEKVSDDKKEGLKFSEPKVVSKNEAEISVDLQARETFEANTVSMNSQAASANGSDYQAMLTNQLQENAGEIVKAGNIVLKDNDVGQIKLILHPEDLGNVKIDLQIKDNSISGKIQVNSEAAFNAFKESAENLKTAFVQSGFENASLDLSFAGQNQNGNNAENQNPERNFAMNRAYSGLVQETSEVVYTESEEIYENSLRNSVNIVA